MVSALPGRLSVAFVISISTTLIATAAAQQSPTTTDTNWPMGIAIMLAAPGQTREKVVANIKKRLRKYDRNGDGLTKQEVDAFRIKESAKLDARVAQYYVQYDLDGDGSVTQEEAERSLLRKINQPDIASLNAKSARWFKQELDRVMKLDINGNKVVASDEMRADVNDATRRSKMPRNKEVTFLFSLDPNKDGRLTVEELSALTNQAFRQYDKNGNGVMDVEESKPLMLRVLAASDKKTKSCVIPKPATNAEIVVFGVHLGESISTVSVAGQGNVTSTRKFVVEPGEKPLFIILTAVQSVIWKFEGNTQRISRAVIITHGFHARASAGVIGLKSNQLHFPEPGSCPIYSAGLRKNLEPIRRAAFELIVGRQVDKFAGANRSEVPHLPSAKSSKVSNHSDIDTAGLDSNAHQLYLRRFPEGVDEIDPAKVIAPKPVQRYDVLPSYAGLVQLLRDDAIERLTEKEYRIVKPIPHLPAGFPHGRLVTFRLGKGVPLPKGSLGRSCVISEESGKQLNKLAKCRTK